jgi:hypothetical protein
VEEKRSKRKKEGKKLKRVKKCERGKIKATGHVGNKYRKNAGNCNYHFFFMGAGSGVLYQKRELCHC